MVEASGAFELIGGSYVPESVEGYYLTPWDFGYSPLVKFDHDFIGREALEKMAERPHRRKLSLALDDVSVTNVLFGMFSKGELRPKYMEFPSAFYTMHPFDRVEEDGELVGISTWIGYSANEGKILTLAMVDESVAVLGTQVDFVRGEPDGGTSKPTVEQHKQVTIKATVAAIPYFEAARTGYADSWRIKSAG